MRGLLQNTLRAFLPFFQVMVLVLVQVFGFIVAAQWNGLVGKTPEQPTSIKRDQQPVTTNGDTVEQSRQTAAEDAVVAARARRDKELELFVSLLVVCLLNSVALVIWLRNTALYGWRMAAMTFFTFFMCMTVMPQSDTLVYLRNPGPLIRLAGRMGLATSGFVAIAVVPLFWRWRGRGEAFESLVPKRSRGDIALRLMASTFLYVALYLVFGYFVAWQDADVRVLYGGGAEPMGFWRHITTPPASNRVVPFQMLRGTVWTLLCVSMAYVSRGGRIRSAISVGLFIAIVMNAQLLLPNPVMNERVRHIHLLETAISTCIFGVVCVWLWTTKPATIDPPDGFLRNPG